MAEGESGIIRVPLQEAIAKSDSTYGPVEQRFIRRQFKDLRSVPVSSYESIFSVQGEPLSLVTISLLRNIFPDKSAKGIQTFLASEGQIASYIDSLSTVSAEKKQQAWPLLSLLPLTAELQK